MPRGWIVVDTLLAVLIAASALYGMGLPIAWLLPAPSGSAWAYRVAIAPLYSIVATSVLAWLLGVADVSLEPSYLLLFTLGAWIVSWRVAGGHWKVDGWRPAFLPLAAMSGASAVVWALSLVGYGLYLPNRDYKNHAYWVAQVSFERSADPSLILRASPLSAPTQDGFYPLGLHTLLGWALPTSDWNALGVTAAAAVVCTAVSLPLAGVVLARLWVPGDRLLPILTGFALAFFPGMTGAFGIGSVTILAAGALYAAGLASLWMWLQRPGVAETVALALTGVGLFLLHIAEAWGLLLVAIAALPSLGSQRLRRITPRTWAVVAASATTSIVVALIILRPILSRLSEGFLDIQPNDQSAPIALLRAFSSQPGGNIWLGMIWMMLTLLGLAASYRRKLAVLPALALAVPMVLAVFASTPGVPGLLYTLTAPWYGSDSRIYVMAGPPVALLGCYGIVVLRDHFASRLGVSESREGLGQALFVPGLLLIVAVSSTIVPDRRESLAATLAGAGDTPRIAHEVKSALLPGETIMNFEGDGTANLFAIARLPVLSGWQDYGDSLAGNKEFSWLQSSLMNIKDPEVADSLAALRVRFVTIGTTSLYWDSQIGYDIERLLQQEQLSAFSVGSDVAVLEYRPEG